MVSFCKFFSGVILNIKKTDILIVGAGPVGLSLAILLKRENINYIIVDKREESTKLPRAIAINQTSLALFDELGILERLKKHSFIVDETKIFWNKKNIGVINFHNIETKYPYFLHVAQNLVEDELENLLISNGTTIYRGHEFIESTDSGEISSSKIKSKDGEYKIQSRYVIGVDGGSSTVRKQLGENLDEEFYGSYFMLYDIEVVDVISKVTRYYFTGDGYCMIVPKNKHEYRIIFSFESDPKELYKNVGIKEFLKQQLFSKTDLSFNLKSITWNVSAKFGHKISNLIVTKNSILAGDALHQFSPIGGTNMNFGLQDIILLSKVIPHIINLENFEMLVTEYVNPRIKQIRQQVAITKQLTKLLTRKNISALSEYKWLYLMLKSNQLAGFLTGDVSGLMYSGITDKWNTPKLVHNIFM